MIHKCPICRHQPVIDRIDNEWYCPECGWQSETKKIVIEQTI